MRAENRMTLSLRRLLGALCFVLLSTSVCAQSEPEPIPTDLDSRVRELLQLGVEQMAPREMWLDLGVEAVEVLIGVVRDTESVPLFRNRALEALSHYADARVRGFLFEFATSNAYESSLRLSALASLAQNYPEDALGPLGLTLRSTDAYERRRAAMILGYMPQERAGALLRERLRDEQVEYVRLVLERALVRHLELRARRNTDALVVVVLRLDEDVLPSSTSRWRVRIEAPAAIQGADQILRLEARALAPEELAFAGGGTWERELAPGDSWELEIETRKTGEDVDGSFGLILQEAGEPASARRIDVVEEQR